ncbi:MAG TPA: phytase [Acidimicrobiia bacterium]|nr:phytase [Acidimicrobiia bacterium]
MSATARPHKTPRRLVGAALGLTLVVAAAPFFSSANAAQPASELAPPALETEVIGGANATDPALWVHPTDPAQSMIIGADNVRLSTYDMSGAVLVEGAAAAANDFTSVDTRNGVTLGGAPVSIATAVGNHTVRFYTIDPATRALTDVSATAGGIKESVEFPKHGGSASNVCMYQSPVSGKTYAFALADNGYAQQLELVEADGKFGVKVVRGYTGAQSGAWDTAATAVDGCVVDDETKTLYVSERGAGIWKFDAEPPATPSTPTPGTLIDKAAPDGNLQNTTKGLAIVRTGEGAGYLLASSFDGTLTGAVDSTFNVYDRITHAFIRTFKVSEGTTVDNCRDSKGIDATASNVAAGFESGMFICQDSRNRPATGGGTVEDNYKMVAMELIADMAAAVPTTVTTAPQATSTTTAPIQAVPNKSGYWMVGNEGKVYAFGDAKTFGDANLPAGAQAVDLEPTPSGNGYWIIDDFGNVYARGDAMAQPALTRSKLSTGEVVTSLSSTKDGKGYWIFTNLGQVIPFGDAVFYGDMSKTKLNGPVLDSIPTASGKGYYMVASDGGIFSFGDAVFKGSMGDVKLNKPVQSLVPDSDGVGYWLVASDGGIFAFDAAFKGSLGSVKLNKPITGMVRYGDGYMMVGEDGGIFNFSNKPFSGSLGGSPPNKPITSVAVFDVAAATD